MRKAIDGIQKRPDRETGRLGKIYNHGRVKSNSAGSLIDRIEHGAQVAEPGKDFWIPLDQLKIQMGKKLHATISAPLRQDQLNFSVQKGPVDFLDLLAGRWHSGKHAPIHKIKSQPLQIP